MKWVKWALGEAGFRTVGMTLQKVIGNVSHGLGHVIVSTFVIGVVQSIVAFSVLRAKKIPFLSRENPERRLILGSVCFGAGAFVNTVIAFMAYVYGANIAVYTFITLLAIIPGAVIDRIWFREKLLPRQFLGIGVAIFAGWLILKTPNLKDLVDLPIWVWLGIANAFGLAINQGISRGVRKVNPWVKNFWGGATTFILCVFSLTMIGKNGWQAIISPEILRVLLWSGVIAFVVIGIWIFNVIAYRDGGSIPTKHVVVNSAFLILVTISGLVIFGDRISLIQIIGMVVYVGAFVLINNEVWRYLMSRDRTTK